MRYYKTHPSPRCTLGNVVRVSRPPHSVTQDRTTFPTVPRGDYVSGHCDRNSNMASLGRRRGVPVSRERSVPPSRPARWKRGNDPARRAGAGASNASPSPGRPRVAPGPRLNRAAAGQSVVRRLAKVRGGQWPPLAPPHQPRWSPPPPLRPPNPPLTAPQGSAVRGGRAWGGGFSPSGCGNGPQLSRGTLEVCSTPAGQSSPRPRPLLLDCPPTLVPPLVPSYIFAVCDRWTLVNVECPGVFVNMQWKASEC